MIFTFVHSLFNLNLGKKYGNALIIFLISISLLLFIELFSFLNLRRYHWNFPFFINVTNNIDINQGGVYSEIDPLAGWRARNNLIQTKGYVTENNLLVLKDTSCAYCKHFNILITGGSTSDLFYNSNNWPYYLEKLFLQNGYHVNIYIGAVAGYNSGQELLILIRYGLTIKPDVHISYSGANELPWNASFISEFEQNIFENMVDEFSRPPLFMPNTYYTIKSFFKKNDSNTTVLRRTLYNDPFEFYQRNIQLMDAISVYNKYQFLCIVQPINLSLNKANVISAEKNEKEEKHIAALKEFYPKAKNFAKDRHNIYDFSDMFSNAKEDVFIDNCHINDIYQEQLADSVYNILVEKYF